MRRTRSVGGLVALFLTCAATSADGLDRASANSVWVAETGGALWLASSDGSIRVEISGFSNVRTAAVDIRRETVWLLGNGELAAFDLTGALRFSLPLQVPRSVHADLVVVPSTGAVWVGANQDLMSVGADGQLLGAFQLEANTVALAVHEEDSLLWVGTDRFAEARDLVTGAPVRSIALERAERLGDLRVAPESGRLWIAAGDRAQLYEATGELLLERRFPGLRRIAPAPDGAAWLAGAKSVAHLDAGGNLSSPSEPLARKGTIEHLVVSGEGTVWVANQTTIARLPAEGSPADRISFRPPARIWDLATNSDWLAPSLGIEALAEGACLGDNTPSVDLVFTDRGWGVDPATLQLFAEGLPIATGCTTAQETATCQVLEPLPDGETLLGATVSDYAGNESEPAQVPVLIDTVPPILQIDFPADGSVVSDPEVIFEGSLGEPATLTLDGAPVSLDEALRFNHGPVALEEGENRFELVARDCAGNTTLRVLTVTLQPPDDGLPPDPALVAPALDATVPMEFASAVSFLHSGPTPIQTGVSAATLDPHRVVVVRGRVVDREGRPLSGVRVHAPDHPELGETLTRQDGLFDFVANGGGHLRLELSGADHLPAQRTVRTPWRDFVGIEDVVLVRLDPEVTVIETGADGAQVARGSVVEDEHGPRQATLVFPPSTGATLVLPDGTRQPAARLSVRATEYTVGSSGPSAMPAPLPPTSGYTYAVELTADEALAVGASRVEFERPIYHYVENFLGFPVGGIVPVGYFDRDLGVWIGSENGRVVEILSVLGGLAQLDVDGDGSPAPAAELEELGFTEDELARLAELYQPGQSVWRTPIPHFTPWDCNWPYGPPDDAEEPPDPDADEPDPEEPEEDLQQDDDAPQDDEEDPCHQSGSSFIECENQALGERLPIAGTPYSLTYKSDRVPGRRVSASRRIRVSGTRVPDSLKRIELVLEVAGRRFTHVFSPIPRLSHTFTWDGRDAYGRPVHGDQRLVVRLSYVYDAVYYEPAEFPVAFGRYSSTTTPVGDRRRGEVRLTRSKDLRVAHWDARGLGLGGWTLSAQHVYSAGARTLRLGYGATQRGQALGSNVVRRTRILGSGTWTKLDIAESGEVLVVQNGPSWDSIHLVDPRVPGLAGRRLVFSPLQSGFRIHSLAAAPSSVVPSPAIGAYFSRGGCGAFGAPATLYRLEVWPSGFTTLDVLLTAPAITCPRDLAVGPDGSLFVADQDRILRIAPDQAAEVVADRQRIPDLNAHFLTVGSDGSIYYTRSTAHRVWRIAPTGEVAVFAGTGVFGFSGDGGPATLAQLRSPERLFMSPEGSLFILDSSNFRIRRVDGDGIIHTFAGDGGFFGPINGAPALATSLAVPFFNRVGGMASSPGGGVFFTVGAELWRVTQPLPGFTLGEQVVAGKDGGIHVFSSAGRHLRTLDGLTGEERLTFSYDPEGRLAELVDGDGNRTRIEREGPSEVALVSPFGERTDLVFDEDGFLASMANPAGETYRFEYAAGGLLTKVTTPRGYSSEYTYSTLGRLIATRDAAEGTKALTRRSRPGTYEASLETGLGVTTSYGVERKPQSVTERTVTTPAGLRVDTVTHADGRRSVTLPSGTVLEEEIGPDPRFGMAQPLIERLEVTTPSGLTSTLTLSRVANLAQSEDPLSLTLLRDTWTLNGRRSIDEFRKSNGTLTSTSPEGRRRITVLDAQGRPIRLSVPGSEDTSLTYDSAGRVSQLTQGTGDWERKLSFGYDALGRLEEIVEPLDRSFRFAYDEAGRVIRHTLPDGRTVSFQYDENGNLTAVVPPDRPPHLFRYTPVDGVEEYEPPELDFGPATTTYSYDRDRRLVEVTRPDGESVDITYDPVGRPSSLAHPAGVVNLAYEPASGQLASIATSENEILYSYDGPLLTETIWSGPIRGSVRRVYDENFWIRSRAVEGVAITFDYDDDGLLTRAGDLVVSRDPASGRVLGTTLGSVETTVSYDPFGDLQSLEATAGVGGLYATTFERDKAGRIAVKTEIIGGLTQIYRYAYDGAGRLERVERNGALVEEYRYDANGNRLVATYPWGEREGTYDDHDRLLTYGDATFTYTAAGELLTRTETGATTAFDYDVFGNLRCVELPSGDVIEYVIDGRNRRIGKKVNGSTQQAWLYKDQLNPVAELDGSGNMISRFVYGFRRNVPSHMVKDGATYRLISDHIGSVRLVVDVVTGAVVQRLDYDAFGRIVLDTNPGFQPFGFAGGLYDHTTGLARFGVRDYDAQTGRWTTKDPLFFGGGLSNLFAYVDSDPVNQVDVEGMAVEICRAVADIPGNVVGMKHAWIRTEEKEAGLGQAGGGVPGEGEYRLRDNSPYITETEVVDHEGRGDEEGSTCEPAPDIDEECVNREIVIGEGRGKWSAFNQCQSYVSEIIRTCRKPSVIDFNPGRPGYRQSPL